MLDDKLFLEPPVENADIVDPLGEIQRLARTLWIEDGKPEEGEYQHYWERAEGLLLSGRGDSESSDKKERPSTKSGSSAGPVGNKEADAITESIPQLLRSVFGRLLSEHEGICLYHLLSMNNIEFRSGKRAGRFNEQESAELLSLAAEAPGGDKNAAGSDLSTEEKQAKWQALLDKIQQEDSALSFADRNTIQRLAARLKEDERVKAIVFADEPQQLS